MTDATIPEELTSLPSSGDDDSLSELDALLKNAESAAGVTQPTETVTETTEAKIAKPKPAPEKEKELTPLEKLKLQKEQEQKGQVVSNDDLAEDAAPLRDFVHNDERMEDIDETLKEMDETYDKRKAVVLIRRPQNGLEFAQAMLEIDCVKFDSIGKAYIDMKDKNGNELEPVYIRIRKDDEEYFDFSDLDQKYKEEKEEEIDPESPEGKKKNTVQIIIDKTGLGTDFMFTAEEKLKITEADSIIVKSQKIMNINSIKSSASNKSFQDVVNQYDVSGTRTTMCFPGSGFKADLKGMGYGEYADVAIDVDNGFSFDKYYKRLSVIYNKMTNISTGPFKDFETFLKNFAYTDISLAVYGLFLSTEEEEQQLPLRCGNPQCDNSFNWGYRAHTLLRLDECADLFLDKMQRITTASPTEYDQIKAESEVMNPRFVSLPISGFVVEIGIASAYDFLYNFIPLLDEDTFEKAFPDAEYEDYSDLISLLTIIRSVRVPDGDKFIECYGYKDIIGALTKIHPKEIKILFAYMSKLQESYSITFSFGDVTCPHCGNITHDMTISIDELVFRTYQQLTNIEIDLENTLSL